MTARTGGRILVDQLRIQGCDRIFTVPGESFLAVLDALHDTPEIDLTVCRQEGGVAYMADADGKMTGRPGIAFVTRGPGATNASAGVHIAMQDSTPMILFIGQVARDQVEREAFQEIDFRRMYGPMTKWVAEIDDAARILDAGRPFRDRAEEGGEVDLLEALALTVAASDIADEEDHRGRVLEGDVDAGAGVGRTRTSGHEGDAGPPGHLTVGIRHVGDAALLPADDRVDLRRIV